MWCDDNVLYLAKHGHLVYVVAHDNVSNWVLGAHCCCVSHSVGLGNDITHIPKTFMQPTCELQNHLWYQNPLQPECPCIPSSPLLLLWLKTESIIAVNHNNIILCSYIATAVSPDFFLPLGLPRKTSKGPLQSIHLPLRPFRDRWQQTLTVYMYSNFDVLISPDIFQIEYFLLSDKLEHVRYLEHSIQNQ